MEKADVVIAGGGAAGLFCAIEAGKRGRSVVLLEHNASIGEKIRISGGGRCNFTHTGTTAEDFLSENPAFARSALARYTPMDFVSLVQKHRIPYHEKTPGQLFCDGSANEIIAMLRKECAKADVRIVTSCRIDAVAPGFGLSTNRGVYECGSLVVATGGLSIPKLGASDFGYRIARQFGLRVVPTRPGLVPLVLDGREGALRALSGVSLEAAVTCGAAGFRGRMLFTHRGLSGPAVLQVSSYWEPGQTIAIDTLEGQPRRFLQMWKERYPNGDLGNWRLVPGGTEGYPKAEVTVGGVDTRELSSKTMEAVKVPGLYFVGEVVDVTGHLGGYNFQWAWSSGWAAGQAV